MEPLLEVNTQTVERSWFDEGEAAWLMQAIPEVKGSCKISEAASGKIGNRNSVPVIYLQASDKAPHGGLMGNGKVC